MKKDILLIASGAICSLLVGGIIFLASRPPRGSAIRLLPPPTPDRWVIQVSGAVVQPGVYDLPAGSRVRDAVQVAGGFTSDASTAGVNLAAPLEDGMSILILANTPTPAPIPSEPADHSGNPQTTPETLPSADQPAATAVELININTATQEDLDQLPEIGPVIAQRIIDFRTTNGLFTTTRDIMKVPGIGPLTFEKIKNLITIGP